MLWLFSQEYVHLNPCEQVVNYIIKQQRHQNNVGFTIVFRALSNIYDGAFCEKN